MRKAPERLSNPPPWPKDKQERSEPASRCVLPVLHSSNQDLEQPSWSESLDHLVQVVQVQSHSGGKTEKAERSGVSSIRRNSRRVILLLDSPLTGFMLTSNSPHSFPSTSTELPFSLLLLASIRIGAQALQASATSSQASDTSAYEGSAEASSGVMSRELVVTAATPL